MAVLRPFIIGFATTFKHLFKKPIEDDIIWDKEDLLVPATTSPTSAEAVRG